MVTCYEEFILYGVGLRKILFSENTIPIALLQYYYWERFGYLGNTIGIENRGNTIAIVFCAALLWRGRGKAGHLKGSRLLIYKRTEAYWT